MPLSPPVDALARLGALAEIPREVVIDDRLFYRFRPEEGQLVSTLLKSPPGLGPKALVTLQRPDDSFFHGQLGLMHALADLRADRLDEIEVQLDDITSFFASALRLDAVRSEWILELLEAVVRLCGYVEFPLKFHFNVPRPAQLSTRVMPVIETPTHGAWPSGHATEAFAIATVLAGLLHRQQDSDESFSMIAVAGAEDAPANLLLRIALRIAENRAVAGVHYPHDGVAGAVLGVGLGEALVNYLSGAEKTPTYTLAPPAGPPLDDLTGETLMQVLACTPRDRAAFDDPPCARDALLRAIWAKAVSEMAGAARG